MILRATKTYFLSILALTVLASCDRDSIIEPISTAPAVDIMSPSTTDAPFKSGDRILVQVEFSDDVELHEMAVLISKRGSNQPVYQRILHKHGNTYRWIEDTTFVVDSSTQFELRAIASDHELQRTEKSQLFTVEP